MKQSQPWKHQTLGLSQSPNQAVLWLHGWGQTGASFTRLAGLFPSLGRHLLFDQPGFGATPMLDKGAGTEDYADALAAQWNALGLDGPQIIVGHSFGVRVAVQMAAKYPNKVKALILIAGAGLKRKRSLGWKLKAQGMKTLSRLAKLSDKVLHTEYVSAYRKKFGSADYKNAGDLRETFVRVVNEDLSSEASRISCPVLLVYGSEDMDTPVELGEKYQSLMQNARLEAIDGFGHLDILDRGAYQIESRLKPFLEEVTRD